MIWSSEICGFRKNVFESKKRSRTLDFFFVRFHIVFQTRQLCLKICFLIGIRTQIFYIFSSRWLKSEVSPLNVRHWTLYWTPHSWYTGALYAMLVFREQKRYKYIFLKNRENTIKFHKKNSIKILSSQITIFGQYRRSTKYDLT